MNKIKLFIQYFIANFKKVDISAVGGQLAYFFFLSLFPMLLFLSALISYLHIDQDSVYKMLKEIVPHDMFALIQGLVDSLLNHQSASLLSIGILGTIWSASNGVNAIGKALDSVYSTAKRRNFFIQRVLSMFFMIFLFIMVGSVAIIGVFGRQIGLFITKLFNCLKKIFFEKKFLGIFFSIRP